MNKSIICIGMGLFSALGTNVEEFKTELFKRKSAIKSIDGFNCDKYKCKYGAEIGYSDRMSKFSYIVEKALMEAINDAYLKKEDLDGNRKLGFVFGTSLGNTTLYMEYCKRKDFTESIIEHGEEIELSNITNKLIKKLNIKGPVYTISNTCITGINAVAVGMQLINSGKADICIVGCADILDEFIFSGLDSLRALSSKNILEPFSENRDGIILGEGAAFLVLANEECCKMKKKYINFSGYSITNDGKSLTAPDQEAHGLIRAINESLNMANTKCEDVQCIFCCATGTKYNDAMQAEAINHVWKDNFDKVIVTSAKPLVGHTLGASGIIEAIAAILMIEEEKIIPIVDNCKYDPGISPIPLVKEIIYKKAEVSVLFGSGFSGTNGALVLKA